MSNPTHNAAPKAYVEAITDTTPTTQGIPHTKSSGSGKVEKEGGSANDLKADVGVAKQGEGHKKMEAGESEMDMTAGGMLKFGLGP